MKVHITDKHDSRGVSFTLTLLNSEDEDDAATDFLHNIFRPIVKDRKSTFYMHQIKLTPDGCSLQLVEQHKKLAQVDGYYNPERSDEKCTVLVIEKCEDQVPAVHACT